MFKFAEGHELLGVIWIYFVLQRVNICLWNWTISHFCRICIYMCV